MYHSSTPSEDKINKEIEDELNAKYNDDYPERESQEEKKVRELQEQQIKQAKESVKQAQELISKQKEQERQEEEKKDEEIRAGLEATLHSQGKFGPNQLPTSLPLSLPRSKNPLPTNKSFRDRLALVAKGRQQGIDDIRNQTLAAEALANRQGRERLALRGNLAEIAEENAPPPKTPKLLFTPEPWKLTHEDHDPKQDFLRTSLEKSRPDKADVDKLRLASSRQTEVEPAERPIEVKPSTQKRRFIPSGLGSRIFGIGRRPFISGRTKKKPLTRQATQAITASA